MKFITAALLLALTVLGSPALPQARYYGTGEITHTSETISYTDKVDTERRIGADFPSYEEFKYQNACAVVAGATLVGYYDAYYNELIPDFESKYGYDGNGELVFNEQTKAVDGLIDTLYAGMKTNLNGAGTAAADFCAGLRNYVSSRGRSVILNSVMSGGQLNKSGYQNAIERSEPVVLFLNSFVYTIYIGETNPVTIPYIKGNIGHALVGYGYREIRYYRTETVKKWEPVWYNPFRSVTYTERVNFKTDYYARVSFGDGTVGYLNLNDFNTVTGGNAVKIQ